MPRSRPTLPRWVRPLVGIAISAAFVVVTISRVDLRLIGEVWATVPLWPLAVAVLLSMAELSVRALRWTTLLSPLSDAGYRIALAYLSIGHLANAVLPARLGDVARALFAGTAFRMSRTSALGTIAVERVVDAALLGIAASVAILVGYSELAPAVAVLAAGGLGALLVAVVTVRILGRDAVAATRFGSMARRQATRFIAGATALRSPRNRVVVVALTLTSFGLAVAIMYTVTSAVGLTLSVWQAALVMAAVTLSTAIPAGPASLGTYEFVGVSVLATMGMPPEHSLLAVALVHLIVTVPPAVTGLVSMWAMGIRHILPAGHRERHAAPGHLT